MLDRIFKLREYGSNPRQEFFAGLTTFLSSAYILIVNPIILSNAGMDIHALFFSTVLSIIVACLLGAFVSNLPIVFAPAMGSNSWFAFYVVISMGLTWQKGLAAVFIAGILFVIFTVTRMREYLIDAFSNNIKHAIAAGIGLFIATIGFVSGGVIRGSQATVVSLGDIFSLPVAMTFLGVLMITILEHYKVKGSFLIVIAILSVISLMTSQTHFSGVLGFPDNFSENMFKLDFSGILEVSFIAVVLSVFLMDFLDSTGTFISVMGEMGKGMNDKRVKKGLLVDGLATSFGAMVGTSTLLPFLESIAGVKAGGRTGLTTLFVGMFFLLAVFLAPLLSVIPVWATSPILIYIGALMFKHVIKIEWDNVLDIVPCFVTIILMPMTYSITHGIGIGIISWVVINIFAQRFILSKHWILILISLGYILIMLNH